MILSVIIPFHEYNSLLDRIILSILPQLSDFAELILVGDGVTEKESNSISQQYPIRIYTIPKSGANSARQYGMNKSIGEYLLFVDSDDVLPPNTLQTYYTIICSHTPDIIIGNVLRYIDSKPVGVFYNFQKAGMLRSKETLSNMELYYFPVLLFCKCLKRNTAASLSFANSSMYQDFQLTCNVFKNSESLFFTEEITYHYYMRENSVSSKSANTKEKLEEALPAIDAIQNHYKQFRLSKLDEKFLFYSTIKFYFTLINRALPLHDLVFVNDLRNRFKNAPYFSLRLKNITGIKPYIIACILYYNVLFKIYYTYQNTFKRN